VGKGKEEAGEKEGGRDLDSEEGLGSVGEKN